MDTRAAKKRFRRTQYLVAKKFQLRYVGLILLLIFLTAAVCSYVMYYTMMVTMGEKLAGVYPQGRLVAIVNAVNFRIMVSVMFLTPIVAIVGIFLSHRIAGPINRMERFLNNMASGDLSQHLVLRLNDEMISLANGINRLSDSMKSFITGQRARLNRVSTLSYSVKDTLLTKPKNLDGLRKEIDDMDIIINELISEFDKFKVEEPSAA